jgi:hypothetical protein
MVHVLDGGGGRQDSGNESVRLDVFKRDVAGGALLKEK